MSNCTCSPGKGVCRSCLQTIEQRNAVSAGPVASFAGEYTFNQVAVFEKQFKDNIVNDVANNPLAKQLSKHPDFYDSLSTINNDFLKRDYISSILPDYKVLNHRASKGPITALEWASFLESSNYTPATAIVSCNATGPRFCDELDKFYNGDFTDSVLGGFCSLFSSIFAAIDAFFDIVDSIDGLIQDVFSFLKKIKNIKDEILAAFEAIKVKAIIEAIKEKIGEMIEGTIKKVCQSIANFNVEAITGPLPTPSQAQQKVVEEAEDKKSKLQEVCGEENAKRIKDKFQALIDYAVGLFENPSLEEIMMLISRICSMAVGVENLFKKLKDPLNDFANRYDEVFNTLKNASNRITGEAIRAGAVRPTEEKRQELINNAREVWEDQGDNTPPPTQEEMAGVPSWDEIKDNNHPKIRIRGGWTTRMSPVHEGWTMLTRDVKVKLLRLQEEANAAGIISGPLYLNSGYRNPYYNELVDGATASMHLDGKAIDITWDGFRSFGSELNDMVELAMSQKIGFKRRGLYNNFIHLDVKNENYNWDKRTGASSA